MGSARNGSCHPEVEDRPLEEVVAAIDGATIDFAAGAPQLDDQTVVLLRRDG